MQYIIHTIGIQKQDFEVFKEIVGNVLVIDVRRRANPLYYSEKYLRKNLPNYWRNADLGPPKSLREEFKTNKDWNGYKIAYRAYLKTTESQRAIKECIEKVKQFKEVYLMCFERLDEQGKLCSEEDIKCHRILLKSYLEEILRSSAKGI